MKKLLLTFASMALLASSALAQSAGPGEDRAAPSAQATPAEKAGAKANRKTIGKQVAKTAQAGDDQPATPAMRKVASKSERREAAMKRKAAGAKATKGPKDASGPND